MRGRLPSIQLLLAAFLPALALPPAPFEGGEWLMLPGLMAWYAVITAPQHEGGPTRRPLVASYVLGVVQMLWFSWSLRFLTIPGYLAIGFAGGLYFVLAALVTRAPVGRGWALGRFAFAVAAAHWLRAHLPEIWYPHGQPIHAMYEHPELLGMVRWYGEAAGNFALAFVAGALVDLWRSWHRAVLPRRTVLQNLALALGIFFVFPNLFHPPETRGEEREVDVLLVEPGFDFERYLRGERTSRFLIVPSMVVTRQEAGPGVEDPPDLVVWPESAFPFRASPTMRDYSRRIAQQPFLRQQFLNNGLSPGIRLADGVRLLAGAEHERPGDGRRGVTVLLDEAGKYVGHQEKLHPVPGGERLPFIDWLPRTWADKLVESVSVVNVAPDLAAGEARPPLETADGVKFSALLCFDNAFDDVGRIAARKGSEFCVVASNEAWYRQGGELPQMVAMTVCRALETGLPWVRSTVDGRTVAIDRDGRVTASLGPAVPGGGARTLRTTVRASWRESIALHLQGFFGPTCVVYALALLVVGRFRRGSAGTAERSSESNP